MKTKPHRAATASTLILAALLPAAAMARNKAAPPDPMKDPMLITAGFLEHHQDLKYRLLGMKAYGNGEFEDAMRYFRRAGYFADKPSQGMIGEMYWNGEGVPRDRALAYAWMDLAAERGYRGFIGLRERYWNALDESERARALAEGQAILPASATRRPSRIMKSSCAAQGRRSPAAGRVSMPV